MRSCQNLTALHHCMFVFQQEKLNEVQDALIYFARSVPVLFLSFCCCFVQVGGGGGGSRVCTISKLKFINMRHFWVLKIYLYYCYLAMTELFFEQQHLFRSLQITPDSMPPPPRTPSPIFCDTSTPLQDTDQPDPRKLVY